MGEYSNARFGLGSVRERGHLVDQGVHGSILLKPIIKKEDGMTWTGLIRFRMATGTNVRH
jgi:hypothetical protein